MHGWLIYKNIYIKAHAEQDITLKTRTFIDILHNKFISHAY